MLLRAGRGDELNGNLVDFIIKTFIVGVVRRAMDDALFFARATGRHLVTERDIQTGFMNAAHECRTIEPPAAPPPPSGTPDDAATSSDADSTASESSSVSDSDDDADDAYEGAEFTTALDPALDGSARAKAIEMKRRAYEWHAYAPSDPIELAVRHAVDLIILRVRFRPAPP